MKFFVVIFVLALCFVLTESWTLSLGGTVFDGSSNRGCTAHGHPQGQTFSWNRGFFESCCVHLYSDTGCSNQIGVSCPPWEQQASRDINGFSVSDC